MDRSPLGNLGKCDFSYCCADVALERDIGQGLVAACTGHQEAALELARRVCGADFAVVVSVFLPRVRPAKRRQLLYPSYG